MVEKRGFVLVAVIIVFVVASIVVFSLSIFIAESLKLNNIKRYQAMAINAAHAGIQSAIYNYRFRDLSGNGYFPLNPTIPSPINADNSFKIDGSQSDLFMVNTRDVIFLDNGNKRLGQIYIQNATNSKPLTITQMTIDWVQPLPDLSSLRLVRLGGRTLWNKGGKQYPPQTFALNNNNVINTVPSTYELEVRFSEDMTGMPVDVTFFFSDGTNKKVRVYPAANNNNFIIKVTGKLADSTICRGIQAEYNANTGKIIDYKEFRATCVP